jgi:vacuolar-type H+-ATPase subunit H
LVPGTKLSFTIKAERLVYQEQQRIREESERIIREQKEEQQRIIREQQQRIEKEKSDFKDLYQQAKRWQRAKFIREYLNSFEKNAFEKGVLTDEVQSWINWANDKAEWYYPLVNKADKLLNHLNINTLFDL